MFVQFLPNKRDWTKFSYYPLLSFLALLSRAGTVVETVGRVNMLDRVERVVRVNQVQKVERRSQSGRKLV